MALSPLFNVPFLILTLSILTEAGVLPQSYNARGIHARSPTATTPHVVQISRKASSEVSLWRKAYGVAKVLSLDYGLELAATLTIGGTDFEMILDTGSSDTWIAGNNFSCQDFGFEVPQNYCGLGATYNFKGDKSTFQQIPHENFNIQYGDGSAIAGLMGYENLAIAGIEVPKQEIAVMTMAYWRGDGQTSGLLGLGYPGLTSAFKGDDPNNDFNAPHAPYDPIFTTMVKQNSVLPTFSLAIERGPANGLAGVLAIGGIPPVKVSSPFISSPIVKTQFPFAGDVSSPTYQFYSIYPDAFVFGQRNHSAHAAEPATTTANLTAFDSSKILHLVDSGTSLNLLPQEIADAVNAQFVPPAVYDPSEGLYTVPCNAKAPYFGVKISGQTLFFNTKDMIFKFNGVCRSTITGGGEPYILGDPFFRNVLVVFDVGAGLMRFASRPSY